MKNCMCSFTRALCRLVIEHPIRSCEGKRTGTGVPTACCGAPYTPGEAGVRPRIFGRKRSFAEDKSRDMVGVEGD